MEREDNGDILFGEGGRKIKSELESHKENEDDEPRTWSRKHDLESLLTQRSL